MSASKTKKQIGDLLAMVMVIVCSPLLAIAMNTDDDEKNSPQLHESEAAKLNDQKMQQYFRESTEQKSEESGWTDAWRCWRQIYYAPGLRQIIGSYVFDNEEENRSLQWTDEGRYCYVLQTMLPQWRKRLVNNPQVFELFTTENLSERLLNDEPAVLLLFAERVRQEPSFKDRLWNLVQQSKFTDNQSAATAAANALSILNAAGVSFSGRDLRDINAPGANLNAAVLDGTDLRGANLVGAWLGSASMNQARFSQAQLQGVNFGKQLFLKGRINYGSIVNFSRDAARVVSGSDNNTVKVWDMISGKQLRVFKGHTRMVTSVNFSADGTRVASGSKDHTVRVWDMASGNQLQVFTGHTDHVTSVSFSGDGKRVASGSLDNTVRVWNAAAGNSCMGSFKASNSNQLQVFTGHTDHVTSVSFSSDGKRIASGSRDKTVRVWDVISGHQIQVFKHSSSINSVSFSADGKRVASGGNDNTVRVWGAAVGNGLVGPLKPSTGGF